MQPKLNELSLTAAAAESLAMPNSGAFALPNAVESRPVPMDILQVAARLRVSLSGSEQTILTTGLAEDDDGHQLARLLAEALGQLTQTETALVDGDCRLSPLSAHLAIAPSPGFMDVAAGAAELSDIASPYPVPNVTFFAAGASTQILTAPGCARAMEALKKRYRFVVVAAPSFYSGPDAVTLASMSDGVVLALAAGERRKTEVQVFQRELTQLRLRLFGAVLMDGVK